VLGWKSEENRKDERLNQTHYWVCSLDNATGGYLLEKSERENGTVNKREA
jgi:hypothetical protein